MSPMLAPPARKSRRSPIRIGPADHGRTMSLDEFDKAIGQEGFLYELNKGVIEVSDVPNILHGKQLQEIRDQLVVYRVANPGVIDYLSAGSDSKLLVGPVQSERHPDLSVYLEPQPEAGDIWAEWIPAIVVEVVSERSSKRDYDEKPDEYLAFGVDEYWIVDPAQRQMTVLTRSRAQWRPKVIKASQKYATRRLPGFTLDLKRVLDAR